VRDVPGVAARISQCLAEAGINIRLIIQGIRHDQSNDVSLIIAQEDADRTKAVLHAAAEDVGAEQIEVDSSVAKVSVIGSGVASTPGVAARMFQALARRDINIDLISSSEVRIACIIREDQLDSAVRAIHDEFGLEHLERTRVSTA
jgi:aspartate kinase